MESNQEGAELPAAGPGNGTAENKKPVLLIVDDEAGPRESLRIVFKDRYQCVIANCGREGIDYALNHPVDVAIIDIKMPDISGIEVLREIKQHDPDVECVMLTGYETMETARGALRHGAADYLSKPFDVFAIRDRLDACVQRRHQRLELTENLRLLKQTNEELAAALAHRDRAATAGVLSAGVIHEINDPLTIITYYLKMLDRDLSEIANMDPKVAALNIQQRQSRILREIERCRNIAKRFLGFTHQNHERSGDEVAEVAKIIEDAAALSKAHPAAVNLEITIASIPPDLRVHAHPVELLQVILNLSVNAIQAMSGRGCLSYAAEVVGEVPGQLQFRSESFDPQKPLVKMTVNDTGKGIPPELIDKVFTPYFSTRDEGSGLGLAIVTKLVGHYRGAIGLRSVVGQGTSFDIYLQRAT